MVIDANYLCHRAFHVFGKLSHQGMGTGIAYGVLRDVREWADRFQTDMIVFGFDSLGSKRKLIYPEYKANRKRKEKTDDEIEAYNQFLEQVDTLQHTLLPSIGFNNIFSREGFEGDDILGSVSRDQRLNHEVILVSSDEDMYQLLHTNVSMWNPRAKKLQTLKWFREEYGIAPKQWRDVKAIAGCTSDNIKGIAGVGEKTAVKYITGEINTSTKAYKSIESKKGKAIAARNMPLVSLPFKGTPHFRLRQDEVTERSWERALRFMGISTRKTKGSSNGEEPKGFGF
jgi:DNA polymerase-1